MNQRWVWGILVLFLAMRACTETGQTTPSPPPIVVPATATLAPLTPTFTPVSLTPIPTGGTPVSGLKATVIPLPTVAATRDISRTIVIASHEAGGPYAIAALTAIHLTPGHSYQLLVTSPAGQVAFHGEWSSSAMGADGFPGVQVGLLEGTTPVTYDIRPPVQVVARDWLYSASVQNKGAGGITLTLVDVTELE